jgi:hypothetical protein
MWKRLAILLPLAGSLMNTGVLAAPATYYPTHGWRESTPEAQGLHSIKADQPLPANADDARQLLAKVKLKYLGTDLSIPAGLDGVYRLGPHGPLKLLAGATGKWTSDTDFAVELNFISNINRYTATVHFDGDNVQMTIAESSGLIRNGHLVGKKAL